MTSRRIGESLLLQIRSATGPVHEHDAEIGPVRGAISIQIRGAGGPPADQEEPEIAAIDVEITVEIPGNSRRFAGIRRPIAVQILTSRSRPLPGGTRLSSLVGGQRETEPVGEASRSCGLRAGRGVARRTIALEQPGKKP